MTRTPKPHDHPTGTTILVVDVGGTHIKVRSSDMPEQVRFDSGKAMTARAMVDGVLAVMAGQRFDVVAMGYPGPVADGRVVEEPINLGPGWTTFDWAMAFGAPVRIINDAAMQALGNYEGGRMLFLGFGTGMGSALIVEGVVQPLELAHLPYRKGKTYEEYVGAEGRRKLGAHRWRHHALQVATMLRAGLQVQEVVIGGGNGRKLGRLPEGMRLGRQDAAFHGGLQLWAPLSGETPRAEAPAT